MKNIAIIDIDGTISKVGDRLKYLQQSPKDWDSFYNYCYEDEPIQEMIDHVYHLEAIYHIIFCTGRRESVRQKTIEWINYHIPLLETFDLVMRPDGDYRHDTIVKPEQLESFGVSLNNVAVVIEDRNSMVAKWREMGLLCLQPFEGYF